MIPEDAMIPDGDERRPGPTGAPDRLLPWRAVQERTGLSRTTAWRMQKTGEFPAPVIVSRGRVGWRQSEVDAWTASRVPRAASGPPRTASPCAGPVASVAQPRPAQPKKARSHRSSLPAQITFGF
jgi:predicted DNA-binding transcriptional regulator AlpA